MRTVRGLRTLVVAVLLGVMPGWVGAGVAHAAGVTWYVATTGSNPGSCPLAGNSPSSPFANVSFALSCAAGDNTTASTPDTIVVAAGTYPEANLIVNAYVTIAGVAGATTVNGGGTRKVLTIASPYSVRIRGLTITGGLACSACKGAGGGINNQGTLSISNSTLSGNTACSGGCSGLGGGIYNEGTLSISNSTLSGNTGCRDNCVTGSGGAIFNGGTLSISNSTLSANTGCIGTACVGRGGGIRNEGTLSISNSTLSANTACNGDSCDGTGGGILNGRVSTLTVVKSILGGNTSAAGNIACSGTSCSGSGGALLNGSAGSVTLIGNTVTFNAAYSGAGSSGDGGAIFNFLVSPILHNDTIQNNTPDNCAPPGSVTGCAG